ncbi:MAG: hypothetical protein IIC82_05465 [Chloroflexi bacterium]|nr:hypothetical protein [Chloroflexota bacterium]
MGERRLLSRVNPALAAFLMLTLALIFHGYFALNYQSSRESRHELVATVEVSERTLARLRRNAEDVETITNAREQLAAAVARFPDEVSGPNTIGRLIQMATDSNLAVADVSSQSRNDLTLGERSYESLEVRLELEGTMASLREFLRTIESGAIPAVTLDRLSVMPATTTSSESETGPARIDLEDGVRASLTILAYARVTPS